MFTKASHSLRGLLRRVKTWMTDGGSTDAGQVLRNRKPYGSAFQHPVFELDPEMSLGDFALFMGLWFVLAAALIWALFEWF